MLKTFETDFYDSIYYYLFNLGYYFFSLDSFKIKKNNNKLDVNYTKNLFFYFKEKKIHKPCKQFINTYYIVLNM